MKTAPLNSLEIGTRIRLGGAPGEVVEKRGGYVRVRLERRRKTGRGRISLTYEVPPRRAGETVEVL